MDIKTGIKKAIKNGHIVWVDHSIEMIKERKIKRSEVKEAIIKGDIIEEYLNDKPYPSYLIHGIVKKKHIHVVLGYFELKNVVFIITLYEPNLEKFEPDYRTRRK